MHHFHVVFTLPSELRLLTMYNRREIFRLLFESASLTLKKLAADDQRLGASLGITAVLHTWSRDLSFHPHIHCVVTGGGLGHDDRWVKTRPQFLFPVKVLGKLFRGIFMDRLKRLHDAGKLKCTSRCSPLATGDGFQKLIDALYGKRWLNTSDEPDFAKRLRLATGVDLTQCPVCSANMTRHGLTSNEPQLGLRHSRAPPQTP